MRLFFGLSFDPPARAAFAAVQAQLRRMAERGNFTAPENFHLTLAFLGEVEPARLPELFSLLRTASFPPLALTFDRLDRFDGGIWHLDPMPSAALSEGQAGLEAALRAAGFPLEDRPYVPHLTLGRKLVLPDGSDPAGPLEKSIAAHSPGPRLFHSHREEERPHYTPLDPSDF